MSSAAEMPAVVGSPACVPHWLTMPTCASAMGSLLTSVPACQAVVSTPCLCAPVRALEEQELQL